MLIKVFSVLSMLQKLSKLPPGGVLGGGGGGGGGGDRLAKQKRGGNRLPVYQLNNKPWRYRLVCTIGVCRPSKTTQ